MRITRFLPAAIGSALLLSSCSTSRFYTPNTINIPMLSEAGEGTVSGAFSQKNGRSGLEAQAIYSPVKHLGFMANYFNVHYSGKTVTDISSFFYETQYEGHQRFAEGGIGGYFQAGPSDEYLLSLFAGLGQGKTFNRYSPPPDAVIQDTYDSDWRYRRWFVQPALGLKYRRFQVGTALRFAWVNYLDGNINSRVGVLETDRIQLLDDSSPLFLTEMAWSFGYRLRPVIISLNSTAVVRGSDALRELDLATNYVSVSVGLNIHELKKRKK